MKLPELAQILHTKCVPVGFPVELRAPLKDECLASAIIALKFKFKSKDEVPAEHASLYVEREGAWWLDVDGAVEKSKLDEFRNTNVALLKERDELKQRLEGIDQAVVTEATKRGLRATAIPDITARARNTFRLVSGVPQAFEADGQTARVGKDGVTPLTLAEWIDAQGAPSPSPQPFPSGQGLGEEEATPRPRAKRGFEIGSRL